MISDGDQPVPASPVGTQHPSAYVLVQNLWSGYGRAALAGDL